MINLTKWYFGLKNISDISKTRAFLKCMDNLDKL